MEQLAEINGDVILNNRVHRESTKQVARFRLGSTFNLGHIIMNIFWAQCSSLSEQTNEEVR